MANQTDFLKLTLPANNEFNNTWDTPLNANFVAIDLEIETISNELQSARFDKETLAEFLAVSHFDDGTLRPSQEGDDSRNSPVYGDDDGVGNDHLLKNRLDLADREMFDAREAATSLLQGLERRGRDFDHADSVIDGPKTGSGQPNFLSSAGAEFKLEADPIGIDFNINGRYMTLKVDENVTASGGDGTKYLVAKIPATAIVTVDRAAAAAGTTTTNPLNSDKVQHFQDGGVDFSTSEVRAGMILEILNTANAREYIIGEVAPGGNVNKIQIIGRFDSAVAGINYNIRDPLKPEFSVEDSYTIEAGKVIIGEGAFASGSLTSDLSYNFKGEFESNFVAIDVSSVATFEETFNHNLGFIPKELFFYASQANDDSAPYEPLSTALAGNDLAVNINNTIALDPGTWDAGTTDADYNPLPSLSGDVTGNVTGSVYMLRSVQVKFTKTQIIVKNVRDNHFYRDYDGTDRDVGFLKVLCRK